MSNNMENAHVVLVSSDKQSFNKSASDKLENSVHDTYSCVESQVQSGNGIEDGVRFTVSVYEIIKNEIWKVEVK